MLSFHLPVVLPATMLKLTFYTLAMETKKVSKKALRTLVKDSVREAIGRLELPAPTKKLQKLIDKSSKRIAGEYADLLKKERKKNKAVQSDLTFVEDVLNGKATTQNGKKEKKTKKVKAVKASS